MSDIFDDDAFCPLGWNGIYIDPNGDVHSCCVSKNSLGNINQQTVEDILIGDSAISTRKQMLSGTIVPGCKFCYPEKRTSPTLRENWVAHYRHQDRSQYESPNNFRLRYADIRLRNTCNYGCIYCGPVLSSFIAKEQKQFPILKEEKISHTIEYFKNNASTLDRIYLAGGEPLLVKENETLLEELVRVNPRCQIFINTNLSQIQNNRIFELLKMFVDVRWMISAEDMEERYEYIRYKGSWDNFRENLLYLKEIVPIDKIQFNMVYLSLNSKSIFKFLQWLKDNEFDTEQIELAWVQPESTEWDPRYLSDRFQAEIFHVMEKFDAGPKLRNEINNIRVKFQVNVDKTNRNRPIMQLQYYDKIRKMDSKKVFPEIYQDLSTILQQP